MPTHKKTPAKESSALKVDKEHLSVYLAPAVAKRLRARAVHEGKRYSSLIEELVIEGLERREP